VCVAETDDLLIAVSDVLLLLLDMMTGEGMAAATQDGVDSTGTNKDDGVVIDCLLLMLINGDRGIDNTKDVGFSRFLFREAI